jgi:D-xylose 1-dehydrogenase (NADP+, D-xylono-1,5-lactone-forming)
MKRKIRWGILGCARIAERALIPAITEASNATLYGIASRDVPKANEWKEKFNFQKVYPDYQSLLDDPDIDAIYNPLPNHLHCEWTCKAAKAGKHILCEKPMALDVKEVKKMIRETDKYDVLIMEAFMYRFHPQHTKVLQLIESGEIGELRNVQSAFTFMSTTDSDNYRWRPEMGGGALMDVGCYPISAARMILGTEPISVSVAAHFDAKRKVDLSFSILLEFPEHRTALIHCSFEAQFQDYYQVVGTKGKITASRAFIPKMQDAILDIVQVIKEGQDREKQIVIPAINQYRLMVEHFDKCIMENHMPRFPADDALYNMRVINAAQESAKTGKVVKLKNIG